MNNITQYVRALGNKIKSLDKKFDEALAQLDLVRALAGPPSITQEIDEIEGRRVFYFLNAVQDFTIADNGRRGDPLSALVSQDGPFIATHFPIIMWRPTAPDNTQNFGLWRPVSPWPFPDQATPASANFDLDEDIISISYEVQDAGSQRNFQNLPIPPALSRPDNLVPLPVPTMFTPNSTLQTIITYHSIRFSSAQNPPTQGQIVAAYPGYRIANM